MTDTDRTILITGATSGLGRELAHQLAAKPGRLILHGRNSEKVLDLRSELSQAAASIDVVVADLSDQNDVRQLADDVAEITDHLTVLVNNAGIGKGSKDIRELSPDGYELRLAVNHLAPFALSLRLLPLLEIGAPSRIVNVASGAQEPLDFNDVHLSSGYTGNRAYSQSKLALITTGFTLADRLPPEVVTVNSLHPATLMPTSMVHEGYGYTIDDLETGVAATLRLIESDDVEAVTGKFFSGQSESEALPQASDPEIQRRLWDLSEDLTGATL